MTKVLEQLAVSWRRAIGSRERNKGMIDKDDSHAPVDGGANSGAVLAVAQAARRSWCVILRLPESMLVRLPDSLVDEIYFFLVDVADVAMLACCDRVLAQRFREPSVWSELARLGFSRGRGLVLPAHDASGTSLRQQFKSARHVTSWPSTLSTWGFHADMSTHLAADGIVDVRFVAKSRARSNRCVAGDKPFGCLSGDLVAVPGVTDRPKWRLMRGAYYEVTLCATPHSRRIDTKKPAKNGFRALNLARPCVAIGLCTSDFVLEGKQPGWDHFSWAFHADDGLRFHGRGIGSAYGRPFVAGDTVGCGVFRRGSDAYVFYTLDGELVDDRHAFALPSDTLDDIYPVLGMDTNRIACQVNFGTSKPFLFNLDDLLDSPFLAPRAAHKSPFVALKSSFPFLDYSNVTATPNPDNLEASFAAESDDEDHPPNVNHEPRI